MKKIFTSGFQTNQCLLHFGIRMDNLGQTREDRRRYFSDCLTAFGILEIPQTYPRIRAILGALLHRQRLVPRPFVLPLQAVEHRRPNQRRSPLGRGREVDVMEFGPAAPQDIVQVEEDC